MTDVQFRRWLDFSLRLVRVGYAHLPARASKRREGTPTRGWVAEQVTEFITGWVPECDRVCVRDWDGSDDYPEGHEFYRRTVSHHPCYRCKGKGCKGKKATPYCDRGYAVSFAHPSGVGDMFADWTYEGFYWGRRTTPAEDAVLKAIDRREDPEADEKEDAIQEAVEERWCDPVSACVRAGLDVASEPSAGVCGFTAGGVRRMWLPKAVPDWVKAYFEEHETQVLTAVSDFGFRFEPAKISKKEARRRAAFATRFDSFADADEVWL